MNYEIGNPEMAWLLVAIPVVGLIYLRSRWMNRRARQQFGVPESRTGWLTDFVSASLLASGVALLALACMDIRWGKSTREVPQRGLEVVFALDVSRSMLAQDAKPNRLARAKQQIKDLLAEMAGDRVGLVVFAGEAKQAIPLTNHYHDFQQKLDSVGPHSVSVGGSQLGVAIEAASKAFLSKTNDHKTMVLFTDGEDQESKPVELAQQLHKENSLRIFTVGLGDVTEGARIPDDADRQRQRRQQERFVQHDGQQVWSKLNGRILKQIATESDAAYIPAGTKRVNMADVYHKYIAKVEKAEFGTAKINAFVPRFQWFAFPAFLCLCLHSWLHAGSKPRKTVSAGNARVPSAVNASRSTRHGKTHSKVAQAAAVVLALFPSVALAQSTPAHSDSVAARINAANEMVRKEKATEAIDAYNEIAESSPAHQDELNYNLASAHYRNSDFDAAAALFAETATSSNDQIASKSRYNLGNCHYAKALPLADQQPEAAISELQQAIVHFRSALRLDRSLSNARENLERASKLIKQLQEKEEKEEEKQQKEEQQKDQKDQEQENEQKSDEDDSDSESKPDSQQESDSEENQPDKSQADENQESQPPEDQQSPDKADSNKPEGNESAESGEQPQPSESGEDESNRQDASDQQGDPAQDNTAQEESNSQQDSENPQQAQRSQQPDPQSQSSNESPDASSAAEENKEGEQPPTGDLSAVNEADADDKTKPDNQAHAIARHDNSDSKMMTRQEALKLLQSVRDRDMIRRFQQRQRQRQRRVPVEKDW